MKKPNLKEKMEILSRVRIELSEEEKAASLQSAVYKLYDKHPYYAALLHEMRVYYNDNMVPTAGFAFDKKTSKPFIVINSDFFCHLPLEQRVGILQHELMHFTNGHFMRMFKKFSQKSDIRTQLKNQIEHTKDNIAADCELNCYIEALPEGGVRAENFKFKDGNPFPKYKTAEQYRKWLDDNQESNQEALDKFVSMDEHDLMDWDELSEEEKKSILEEAKKTFERTREKISNSFTKEPEAVQDLLDTIEDETRKSNAKAILAMAIKKTLTNPNRRSTWTRPNKRYGAYAPGTAAAQTPNVGIFIDYSGSISGNEITSFLAVLESVLKAGNKQCWLALWHTEVFHYEKFRFGQDFNNIPKQTGGTDVGCVMRKIDDHNLDLSIILTDGYYSAETPCKSKNIVYIISKGGDMNHPMKHHGLATISIESLER